MEKQLISILCGALVLGSCGEDEFSGAKGPIVDREQPGGDDAPAYPVNTSKLVYSFASSYLPDSGTDVTENESQRVARLCLDVQNVNDGYSANTATTLSGQLYVRGFDASQDVYVDQNAVPLTEPTAIQDVDNKLQNLWLSALLFESRNHGYTTPTNVSFNTQGHIAPPSQDLANLFFFDPRPSADESWGGWASTGTEASQASFTGPLSTYFGSTLDSTDSTHFDKTFSAINQSCASYTDAQACASAGCSWNYVTNDTCESGNYKIELAWRTTVTQGPSELIGPVIHNLLAEYNENGILQNLQEYIVKAPANPEELSFTRKCLDSGPCVTSQVEIKTTSWDSAACTF